MPRKPRIDFPGAWHHVMHRGARRAAIFRSDAHCGLFLGILEQVVERFAIEVHAYALMPNHYHLLLRTPQGLLSRSLQMLNARYTQELNRQQRWDGPLFRGRFHSQLVVDERPLPHLLAYIHLNPLRAGLVTRLDAPAWTSHQAYIGRERRPGWLRCDHFLHHLGGSAALHAYVLSLHRGRTTWPAHMSLDTGWFGGLGEPSSQPEVLRADPARVDAREVLEGVCAVAGVGIDEIRTSVRGPRANPARRFAAWALRRHTSLTQREIGALLEMSTVQVANVVRRRDASNAEARDWSCALARYMTNDGF